MISAVAVLDCNKAVTPMPERAALKRLRTLWASTLRRLAPSTRRMSVRTSKVPHTSRAIAASRFSRCVNVTPFSVCPLVCAAHAQQFVQYQAGDTQADGAVGQVKGREITAWKHRGQPAPVELQKINHVAIQQAVKHIAQGAPQDAGQRERKQLLPGVRLEQPQNNNCRQYANDREKPALPAGGAGQKRERCAPVVDPHQIEKRRGLEAVTELIRTNDQDFGELVSEQHYQGQAQPGQHASRWVALAHQANAR